MRLKRLEIQGFKSFAQPVCLEFGPGVTAIVGPNGSGKSNISDALRWVLGEHNIKSLRGSKLEDIIFAGSDGKRPLGMAEVQLTLDNSEGFLPVDYAEVTVARRVYRSGDSEFFINKQNCRLKDIQDLFTDTGLGRESYAVVGQGQIDQVLSVRSEDRRVLLEETAGIIKYRQRKEQALRKLEETSVDLLRVTDVLHELESQLGPLEEQAKQARLYLSLAEELREAELDHFHLSWQNRSAFLPGNVHSISNLAVTVDLLILYNCKDSILNLHLNPDLGAGIISLIIVQEDPIVPSTWSYELPLVQSIHDYLKAQDWEIQIAMCSYREFQEPGFFHRYLTRNTIDGVLIMAAWMVERHVVSELKTRQLPYVVLGSQIRIEVQVEDRVLTVVEYQKIDCDCQVGDTVYISWEESGAILPAQMEMIQLRFPQLLS
jgi:energy-coupling factor transporter ATP-binding protein EcfA2